MKNGKIANSGFPLLYARCHLYVNLFLHTTEALYYQFHEDETISYGILGDITTQRCAKSPKLVFLLKHESIEVQNATSMKVELGFKTLKIYVHITYLLYFYFWKDTHPCVFN